MDTQNMTPQRGNSLALYHSALASAATVSEGESRWHSDPPSKESLAELMKLLDMETLDAVMHLLMPIITTVNTVIQRTAMRQQAVMGGDGMSVTVNGLTQALSMSLSDFIIAMGTVGELPDSEIVDELAAILKRERDAGTLDDTMEAALSLLDPSGKPING